MNAVHAPIRRQVAAGAARVVRRLRGAMSLACMLLAPLASEAQRAPSGALTLDDALRLAATRSPELGASAAEVEQARARVVTARTPAFNPELEVSGGRRRSADGASTDRAVGLSQQLELGGQRRRRASVAEAEVAVAEARHRRASQILAARVSLAFADAARTRALLDIEATDVELATTSVGIARRRLEAGVGTDIEVNLAVATRARAERRRLQALAASEAARFVLAEAMGLGPGEAPDPAASLDLPAPIELDREELLALARSRRADLDALRRELRAAEQRVALARAEGAPDLRVGLFHEREEGDEITGVSVAIGIPVLNRNRGGVLEARAGSERARWEATALERAVEREVAESWSSLRAAQAAASRFEDDVVGSFDENLRLLRRSFEAGKTGVSELLVFRREFLDAQRESVESRADALRAHVLVRFAAGLLDLPSAAPSDAPSDVTGHAP